MQIDFHHAVTYTVTRLAGLTHAQARTVAHAAQYVDDAVEDGLIQFDNGALFQRTSSAHKTLDYRNFEQLANRLVWLPFHFLPGNGGKVAGENPDGGFIDKLVCRPDSPPARDMVRACILERHRPYALHRLGITLHVYADTWAHQGFAGVVNAANRASDVREGDGDEPAKELNGKLKKSYGDLFDEFGSTFVSDVMPLGHGGVLSFPDRPYQRWSYLDNQGERIQRDNPRDFLAAADALCRVGQRFLAGDPEAAVPGLPKRDVGTVERLLNEFTDADGARRHDKWCEALGNGAFSFGAVSLEYPEPGGPKSWKQAALGEPLPQSEEEKKADKPRRYRFRREFLESDWKLFHDALLAHRLEVIHGILPRYGICAA